MLNKLEGKKVLITAGPTWVAIDSVRVIGNMATAETGVILAERFARSGAAVTLLLGPIGVCCLNKKIKIIRFRFFPELRQIVTRQLKSHNFDLVIHSAAVSDYEPAKAFKRKIKSGIRLLKINLKPTVKIINSIKQFRKNTFLVGFKFEPRASREILIKEARKLIEQARADLVVANTFAANGYKGYLVNHSQVRGPFYQKELLTKELFNFIGGQVWNN